MASRAAVRAIATANTAKVWGSHVETWPVIGAVGFAVVACAFTSMTYLTKSPDVQWDKSDRSSTLRLNFSEGSNWSSHKKSFAVPREDVPKIGIMPGVNNSMTR